MVFDSRKSVERFNLTLKAFFEQFPDKHFKRKEPLTLEEIKLREENYPVYYRASDPNSHQRMIIAYCPPKSYFPRCSAPMIHIRTYDLSKTGDIAHIGQLLFELGFEEDKIEVFHQEIFGKVDFNVDLV